MLPALLMRMIPAIPRVHVPKVEEVSSQQGLELPFDGARPCATVNKQQSASCMFCTKPHAMFACLSICSYLDRYCLISADRDRAVVAAASV